MHRWVRRLLATGWGLMVALSVGCTGSNVGDPCTPESVPPGGFDEREAYVETSSVQCRTRVCLWYFLSGSPNNIAEETGCTPGGLEDADEGCVTQADIDERVFCTCRCGAPDGVNTPTCDCPDNFACEEIVTVEGAGQGVRGSYCVPKSLVDET